MLAIVQLAESGPQLIEDIGIYIILVVMLITSFIMIRWMNHQSKQTDEIYEFIKELYTKSNEKINKEKETSEEKEIEKDI